MKLAIEIGDKLTLKVKAGEYAIYDATASIDLAGRNSITLAELRSLIGRLNFVMQDRKTHGSWTE